MLVLRAQLGDRFELVGLGDLNVAKLNHGSCLLTLHGWLAGTVIDSRVLLHGGRLIVNRDCHVIVRDPTPTKVTLVFDADESIEIRRTNAAKKVGPQP